MLVKLGHGMCVNPEIVKLIHVRPDRGAGKPVFTVVLKTDDDGFLIIATFDTREEAEKLANDCANRINRAIGEEDANDKLAAEDEEAPGASAKDDEDEDEDEDDAPAPAVASNPALALPADDDW